MIHFIHSNSRHKAIGSKGRKAKRLRLPNDGEITNTSSCCGLMASRQDSSDSRQPSSHITSNLALKGRNSSFSVTWKLQEGEYALVARMTFVTFGMRPVDNKTCRRVCDTLTNAVRQRSRSFCPDR